MYKVVLALGAVSGLVLPLNPMEQTVSVQSVSAEIQRLAGTSTHAAYEKLRRKIDDDLAIMTARVTRLGRTGDVQKQYPALAELNLLRERVGTMDATVGRRLSQLEKQKGEKR